MKHFLAVLLLLPLSLFAQDCKLKKEVDDFTHETKLSTGFVAFSRVSLSFDATAKEINLFFLLNNAGDSKCFDEESTAVIIFDGSRTKTNYKNNGTMNCDGLMRTTFRNGATVPTYLQRLSTQKVNTITLTGKDKNVTVITLSDEQKQLLQNMATCAINGGKTLVK